MNRMILAALILGTAMASARPLPTESDRQTRDLWLNGPMIQANYDFEGIVALSNCSGSLVRFKDSREDDKAMILSNGHCIGYFPAYGEFVYQQPSRRSFELLSKNGRANLGTVNADQLIYATMTKTDMSLYRLTSTYAEIKSRFAVQAFTLADLAPAEGTAIQVLSGYWRRGYECKVDKIVHRLKEGAWISESSIRYTQPGCEVIGGTSGSPVVGFLNRDVVGVNNTGNEDGGRCTDNNPCEIDENGKIDYAKGRSYGQQTYWLYSCLNANREVDLNQAGCLLVH